MIEFLPLLIIFMIIGAIVAMETRDLLSAVISVGAVGFGLAIAFMFLRAPDVAITQVVVEVLVLIILIRATLRHDVTTVSGDREFFGQIVTIVLLLCISIVVMRALDHLEFGKAGIAFGPAGPSAAYLAHGLKQTGSANIVTAVLLDYRAYDTLGEATVLFTAVIGALAILRQRARKPRGHAGREEG